MLGPRLLDYELYIYSLQDHYSSIQVSTLTVIHQASDVATVEGELLFDNGLRLHVQEIVHVPPEMKHHRIPAPGLSFTEPNLPFLIKEIEKLQTG